MSTRGYVEELEYSDAKGLDTASPINLMASGFVREAKNVNLGTTGGYTKRDGYVNQFTNANALGGNSIRQGIEYRTSTGTSQILLHVTDNSSNAEFGKVTVLGVFSPFTNENGVTLTLNAFRRPSLAQIQDSLYFFDSSGDVDTPFAYEGNGTYTRPLGSLAPGQYAGQSPISGSVSAGGNLETGQYIFAVTYVYILNNSIIVESSPSNLVDVTTTANDKVTLTIPSHPAVSGALSAYSHMQIGVRIWRTVVNGNILFLENPTFELAGNGVNTTFTYESTASDNSLLSEQMPFDNTTLAEYTDYTKARFPVVARNRLLVFHPEQNKGRFSKIGVNGPLPESFPVQNEFSVEGRYGAADTLIGAGQIKGIPIILKERSIGRLEEIGLPDLGNSDDNITYIYREISEVTGAVSHFAQCQVFDELVFLGRDNVYATDGQNVRPIATQIQNIIKVADFNSNKIIKLSAINDTKNKRIYIQIFKDEVALEPNLTLVGDYQQYPNFRWTTYEAGLNTATTPGINAGCFFQTEATVTGGLDIYFGSASNEGQYYKMNSGNSDFKTSWDGVSATTTERSIYMKLVSRPYMFGQPMISKLYKKAKIYAEARDNTYEFEFGAKFDLDAVEVDTKSYVVLGTGTVWAPAIPTNYVWSSGGNASPNLLWTGPALQEFIFNVHRKAQMMQLVFTQDDEDAPLTLLGWGISGSIFGGI